MEMASRIMLPMVPTYPGTAILRHGTKALLRKESVPWNSTPDVLAVQQKHALRDIARGAICPVTHGVIYTGPSSHQH